MPIGADNASVVDREQDQLCARRRDSRKDPGTAIDMCERFGDQCLSVAALGADLRARKRGEKSPAAIGYLAVSLVACHEESD